MRLTLILNVFDRNFVLSFGGEVQKEEAEVEELEHHDLTIHHERASMGFQPNDEEWEDDDE